MTNYKDIKRIPIVAADVPNLAASKITSGTLDNARITLDAAEIPNLDTAKVTSGTFANARISTGSVTQHVAATDLTPVRQDITTLALKQAVNENKAAFNLPNSFIDQFEDDTGIGTETNGDRNSLEYWGTVVSSGAAIKDDAWSSESWDYTKSWNFVHKLSHIDFLFNVNLFKLKPNKKVSLIGENWYNLSSINYGTPKFQEKILSYLDNNYE